MLAVLVAADVPAAVKTKRPATRASPPSAVITLFSRIRAPSSLGCCSLKLKPVRPARAGAPANAYATRNGCAYGAREPLPHVPPQTEKSTQLEACHHTPHEAPLL